MLYRHIAVTFLAFFLALPVAAWDKGAILLEEREHSPAYNIAPHYSLWVHFGWHHAFPGGVVPLIYKGVPYYGPGRTLPVSPNKTIFHFNNTVSWWNNQYESFTKPGLGYTEIFKSDTELSEIVPMRNGNYLVAERWADRGRGAKLVEFNLRGRVAEYSFPEVVAMPLTSNRVLGAMHLELLADQCTVLYDFGNDHKPGRPAIRRLNICTGQPETDFASLLVDEYQGSIRQLPNGDVIVANGAAILQFNAQGSLLRTRQFPGVTHLALSADGATFWAAGVHQEKKQLKNFDPTDPVSDPPSLQFGNPGMTTILVTLDVTELNVVGEWRVGPAEMRPRGRAVGR